MSESFANDVSHSSDPPPNILLLVADQLTPGALPAYGNTVAQTPTIDRLAAEGVVFDSAYCASPLCAPSRYGMLTGRLPSGFNAFDNASELPADVPTIAHHLRADGYRTILAGKMHFAGPDQLHGFEERLTTDIYPADFGWTPDWTAPEARQEWYHNPTSVTQAGVAVRTNQLDFDDEVVFHAERRLFDLAREPDGRPFFMTVSLTHPHDPYVTSKAYWERYDDAAIDLPRVRQTDVPDDPHSARLRRACELDITPLSDTQVRNARHAYYAAVAYVDDQFARILAALEATGQRENTVVVLTSDHGDMLGERGLWYKMNFFEPSARVPLIVHAPRRFGAARVQANVSLLDLLPTLVDVAHGRPTDLPLPIDGRSLWPYLTSPVTPSPVPDEVFAEYLAEIAVQPMVMIRRGPLKFIHSPGDLDLLFNVEEDRDETTNLAGDPAYITIVEQLRAEAEQRWDFPDLYRRVVASQRQRRFLFNAEKTGQLPAWDFQPRIDASRQYVRRHLELDEIERKARFPAHEHGQ